MPPTTAENPRPRTSKHVRQPNRTSKYIYRVAAAPDARLSSVSFRRARARAAERLTMDFAPECVRFVIDSYCRHKNNGPRNAAGEPRGAARIHDFQIKANATPT